MSFRDAHGKQLGHETVTAASLHEAVKSVAAGPWPSNAATAVDVAELVPAA